MTQPTEQQKLTRSRLIQMAIAAVFGAASSFCLLSALEHLGLNLKHMPGIDWIALTLGTAFTCLGIVTIAITISPRLAARQIDQSLEAPPASRRELGMVRLQGTVVLLAGVLLLTPLLATAHGINTSFAPYLFSLIVLVFLGQSVLNFLLWRRADELFRKATADTGSISFWILQGLLFLAASAQRLGLIPNFSLWSAMVLTLGVYSIAGIIVSLRTFSR